MENDSPANRVTTYEQQTPHFIVSTVVVVATAITPTPKMTNNKSTYQLAFDSLGRRRMCSSGGRINETMEIVKHPTAVKSHAPDTKGY